MAYQRSLEWLETTGFVKALSRFAWADANELGDPPETLLRFFHGALIGPHSLKTAFLREGLAGPFTAPASPLDRRGLLHLQQRFREMLASLAVATGMWRRPMSSEFGAISARRTLRTLQMKGGRSVVVDLGREKVIVPEDVRQQLSRSIPRLALSPNGTLEPVLDSASVQDLLDYGLTIAISRNVLLRCGQCAACGALVVHKYQPSMPLWRCFCEVEKGKRDCKTAFHNSRRSGIKVKAKKRSRQEEQRDRERAAQEAEVRAALSWFIDEARTSSLIVRRVKGLKLNPWKMAEKCREQLAQGVSPIEVFRSLPEGARKVLGEEWTATRRKM